MRYIDTCHALVWKQGTNKKIIYLGVYRVTVCSDILLTSKEIYGGTYGTVTNGESC